MHVSCKKRNKQLETKELLKRFRTCPDRSHTIFTECAKPYFSVRTILIESLCFFLDEVSFDLFIMQFILYNTVYYSTGLAKVLAHSQINMYKSTLST